MPVVQPDGAIRNVASGIYLDAKFSSDGTKLYAVSGNSVSAIDVASGSVVAQYTIGTKLGAIDLSTDGHYLAVVEGQAGSSATVYRIDLSTGTITSYSTSLGSSQGSFYDVAFLADGTALVTQQLIGSGSNPLRVLDFGTGQFSIPGGIVSIASNIGTATLTASADHSHVLLEPYSFQQPSYVYVSGTGIVAQAIGIADPFAGGALPSPGSGVQATSPSGNLHIQGVSLNVYDGSLHLLRSLASANPFLADPDGLAFSSDEQKLYVASGNYVFVLDTSTWTVTGAYAPGDAVANARDSLDGTVVGFGDIVQASADGHYLSVIGTNGIKLIDLTIAQMSVTQGPDEVTGHGILVGLAGNDVLSDDGLSASLYGGAGNDTYIVTNTFDQVVEYAGEGHDTVQASVSFSLANFIASNAEDLLLTGSADIDGFGNALDNVITGNGGGNKLSGAAGNDQLMGRDGDDVLDGGAGDDILDGGLGNDTATYVSANGAVTVSLGAAGGQNTIGAGTDTLVSIENLIGSNFDDNLTGDSGANRLDGGAGADSLIGGAGNDALNGGFGNDTIIGGMGNDAIDGGGGFDTVDYSQETGGANVFVNLGSVGFFDLLPPNSGSAVLVDAHTAHDSYGNTDTLTGIEHVVTGAGNDMAAGSAETETLETGAGNDWLNSGGGGDTLVGGSGDDTYVVYAGDTIVELAGGGIDLVQPMVASFSIAGFDNVENITGGLTTGQTLIGNDGKNVINGLSGNDILIGGGGDDILSPGLGLDTMTGGSGNDTFSGQAASLNGDTITDFSRGDRIVISDATLADFSYSLAGNVLTYTGGSIMLTNLQFASIAASAASEGGVQITFSSPPIILSRGAPVSPAIASSAISQSIEAADAFASTSQIIGKPDFPSGWHADFGGNHWGAPHFALDGFFAFA